MICDGIASRVCGLYTTTHSDMDMGTGIWDWDWDLYTRIILHTAIVHYISTLSIGIYHRT